MGRPRIEFQPSASVRLVWPFLDLARKHGRDVSFVRKMLGVTEAELNDPDTRVSQHVMAELLGEAIARTGERDLGLLAARMVDSRVFGIGEYVARTRPTLRAAEDLYERYLPLLGDGAGVAIDRRGKQIVIRLWFSPDLVIHEAAYEFAIAIGVLRARRITEREDLAPLSVHFMHARPARTLRHEELFGCPVHFGADITHVVWSSATLETSLPGLEPALCELLTRQADAMLATLPHGDDVTSRVRTLLAGELKMSDANGARIARRLGMSVRTLTRRLDSEGTSLRAQLDDVRRQIALRELTQGRKSLGGLAHMLGFATTQSFHRAFKRWTGTTATQIRRRTPKK